MYIAFVVSTQRDCTISDPSYKTRLDGSSTHCKNKRYANYITPKPENVTSSGPKMVLSRLQHTDVRLLVMIKPSVAVLIISRNRKCIAPFIKTLKRKNDGTMCTDNQAHTLMFGEVSHNLYPPDAKVGRRTAR